MINFVVPNRVSSSLEIVKLRHGISFRSAYALLGILAILLQVGAIPGNIAGARAEVQLAGDTAHPTTSLFEEGETVRLLFSVTGLSPSDNLNLDVKIVDEFSRPVWNTLIPIRGDSNASKTVTVTPDTPKLGFYRVFAKLSNGVELPILGTRAPGGLTYAVVVPPSKRIYYGDKKSRFGMQGGFNNDANVIPYLGLRWVIMRDFSWANLEPNYSGEMRDHMRQAAERGEEYPPRIPALEDITYNGRKWDINNLPQLFFPPRWASIPETIGTTTAALTPSGEVAWANYLEAFDEMYSRRYPERTTRPYQITWEPAIKDTYHGTMAQLVKIHEIAFTTLSRIDPLAIVAGPTNQSLWSNESVPWHADAFQAGLGNYIGGFSIHPYYANYFIPAVKDPEAGGMLQSLDTVLDIVSSGTRHSIPRYGTEQGFQTLKGNLDSELVQARVLLRENLIMLGENFDFNITFYVHDVDNAPGVPTERQEPGWGYFYDLIDQGWGSGKLSPKPIAPAYAAQSYLLDGSDSIGKVKGLVANALGYGFRRGSETTYALWAFGDTTSPINIPAPLHAYNWMGNEISLPAGSRTDVTLTGEPIYLVYGSATNFDPRTENLFAGEPGDTVWVDDMIPADSQPGTSGSDTWLWQSTNPKPLSAKVCHLSEPAGGFHQQYFVNTQTHYVINKGDKLFTYIYIDPQNKPAEVMVQFFDGISWDHRVVYGGDHVGNAGIPGTPGIHFVAELPPAGSWVRLEVLASDLDLEGKYVQGISYALFNGSACWDYTGKNADARGELPTYTPTSVPTNASTAVPTATVVPTVLPSTPTPLPTIAATATVTPTLTAISTPTRTATPTATATRTFTPTVIATSTAIPTGTATSKPTATFTFTPTATWTATNTTAPTATKTSTATPTSTETSTPVPQLTATEAATLTPTPGSASGRDTIWMDDALPPGSEPVTVGGDSWSWDQWRPQPFSGRACHLSQNNQSLHQHYFTSDNGIDIHTGDKLIAYIYIDPDHPAKEVMLQWNDGQSWEHRGFYGADWIGGGKIGTTSKIQISAATPAAGQWVRLEIPAAAVGLEGQQLHGIAFSMFDGQACWDFAGIEHQGADLGWVDDELPADNSPASTGGDSWNWTDFSPQAYSGEKFHLSDLASGLHQHYFTTSQSSLPIAAGDTLFTYIYIDPHNIPDEFIVQWNDGDSWEHRAIYGADIIGGGTYGTASRMPFGPIPAAGKWIRLEVPAAAVGLEGKSVHGMNFSLFNGRAAWDATGKSSVVQRK